MIAVAAAGMLFGAIDRLVVERAIHPVTSSERSAADTLAKAAAQAAEAEGGSARASPMTPEEQQMIAAAEAGRRSAPKRGDREGAMEALEDMKKAERALEAEDRDRAKSLRALRDELDGEGARAPRARQPRCEDDLDREPAEGQGGAGEALRAPRARPPMRAKATADKRASAAQEGAWSRAADALKKAREAAQRGDSGRRAKQALARAEKEISSIETNLAPAAARAARMVESSGSKAPRSIAHSAPAPKATSPATAKTPPRAKAKAARAKATGKGKSGDKSDSKDKRDGEPGGPGGGGPDDDKPIAPRERIKLNGDLQARTDVREGEKAVSAIEGMGRRAGIRRTYKEIFPSYDTVVEDGLREDNVPAARRPTVRRYFQIDPALATTTESRKRNDDAAHVHERSALHEWPSRPTIRRQVRPAARAGKARRLKSACSMKRAR